MSALLDGFFQVLAPLPLLYMLVGVFLGIVVGAVPGLTGSMLITLAMPLTLYMKSSDAMCLLVSMYVGAISGGLITAILLRIPGTPASIVTTFDGYPMAQQGKGGRAIGLGVVSSFFGGLFSWGVLILLAPLLARIALKFGPFEFFSLVLCALVFIAAVGNDSFLLALLSGLFGMLVATPGLDPVTSSLRLTLGYRQFSGGFGLLPVLIGLFVLRQVCSEVTNIERRLDKLPFSYRDMFPSLADYKRMWFNFVRSAAIGTWIGILPGIGGDIGSIMAYSTAKNSSKEPEKFGKGCEDGVVASEVANNASIGGAFVLLLTLGIPGSTLTAVIMSGLIMHDVAPGPLLFKSDPGLVYAIMAIVFVANLLMFILMIASAKFVIKLVDIPKYILLPCILSFCVIGCLALNNRLFDVWVMFCFGLVGIGLEKANIPFGPFIIGFILSSVAEINLRSALMLSGGSFAPFFTRPLSLAFLILAVATGAWSMYRQFVTPRKAKAKAH